MKYILILLLLLYQALSFGSEVKIEVNPPKPVVGEVFQVVFRIFSPSESEPVINFNPSNVEVVGKSNQGLSTRTVYANGKLTVTREVTIVYDLVASRPGSATLSSVNVQLGNETIRHPLVNLTILKEPEEVPDVFVMADIPKKEFYVGEGFVVRYFIYNKVQVSNLDIKKYPKLNNFLKRFLQEPERTERVSVDGQIYMRTQIYAAKLFPEKVGQLSIDPMQISIAFASQRSGDPFGAFGLSREMKTKTMSSEAIKLQINPLPAPVPDHFTGLVGKHEFDFQAGQSRLIINEPLEIKLTVTGSGALENYEAPELIKNVSLEEFETTGDLKILDAQSATKTFEFTFLAKSSVKIPPQTKVLSYFDPANGKYIPIELRFPEIIVAGGSGSQKQPETERPIKSEKVTPITKQPQELSEPVFENLSLFQRLIPFINGGIAVLIVLVVFGYFSKGIITRISFKSSKIPTVFKQEDFSSTEFIKWISPLIEKEGKSPSSIIRDSELSQSAKEYFIGILNEKNVKEYSMRKTGGGSKYSASFFRELANYMDKIKHENNSPSK